METTETARVRLASSRHATAVRVFGRDSAEAVRARRELAAAHLAVALARARTAGLDDLDIAAVVQSGALPAEATVAA